MRAVPALDDEQRLVGVVSEADLLVSAEHGDAVRHRPRHTGRSRPAPKAGAGTARELMTAPAVTTDAATTVAEAARAMRKGHLSWMPGVDTESRLVGVLGRSDPLAAFLRNDADIRAEIVDHVLLDILLVDPARVAVEVADGVVTLSGELDTHTDATLAVQLVERLEGVVRVADRPPTSTSSTTPLRCSPSRNRPPRVHYPGVWPTFATVFSGMEDRVFWHGGRVVWHGWTTVDDPYAPGP